MSVFLIYARTAWNDYFPSTSTYNHISQTYSTRQTPSNTGVYVLDCLFRSISSTSNGGALFCSNSATYLLIESTSFFSCKTSAGEAGGIYFVNSGSGQSVLNEVCAHDCCSTLTNSNSLYHFAFIYVNNAASNKNYFICSSITRCVSESSKSIHILRLLFGKTLCPLVNMSLNKIYYQLIICQPTIDSNSFTCSLTYSSFTDNIATGHTTIYFWTEGAKSEIKSCNVLRNTQGFLDAQGTIYTNGILMIKDSCILENKATYVFRQASSSYPTTLSNCVVDSTSNNGYMTILSTVTKSFVLALNHMSTQYCHAEYDSAAYQILHCSRKKCFYQPRLSDFFSLTCILIFNFIHPGASSDPWYESVHLYIQHIVE
jgi:hypothetical protein